MNDESVSSGSADDGKSSRIFAIKRSGSLWTLSKRDALKVMASGASALAAAGCGNESPNVKEFKADAHTFQLLNLPDYNSTLPPAGTNLYVVGHVADDYYFRQFDSIGTRTANLHESELTDKQAKLDWLKTLAREVETKGKFSSLQKAQFSELVRDLIRPPTPGRRLQRGPTTASAPGRRMQNADGTLGGQMGTSGRIVPGRRIQQEAQASSTGQESASAKDRAYRKNFGNLVVANTQYNNANVTGIYTDGTCKIEHSAGVAYVPVHQLSELVRMQLPPPTPKPAADTAQSQASTHTETVTHGETTTRAESTGGEGFPRGPGGSSEGRSGSAGTSPRPRPYTPPSEPTSRPYSAPTTRTYTYHYWRPN